MRYLSDVIDEIVAVIPEGNRSLVIRLNAIKQSSLFAAPELQGQLWDSCSSALSSEIGVPGLDWHFEVAKIFSGE